jgi:hypothetical protein
VDRKVPFIVCFHRYDNIINKIIRHFANEPPGDPQAKPLLDPVKVVVLLTIIMIP